MIRWCWVLILSSCYVWTEESFCSEVQIKERTPPPRWNECQNCHRKKDYSFIPKTKKPHLEHQGIHLQHGRKEMSCNFCHDKNNHNFLFSAQKANDFSRSSETCQTCHADVYRKWQSGTHGKRIGGWNHQIQLQCIECHNPHQVSFPKMKAAPAPQKPKYGILKESP